MIAFPIMENFVRDDEEIIPIVDMFDMFEVSEADEAATDKETALDNLRDQVWKGETPAIIGMYEEAAWGAGATVAETEAVIRERSRK